MRVSVFTAVIMLGAATSVSAAPVVYSDRDDFIAATSPNGGENFDSTPLESSYADTTLNVGNMRLSAGLSPTYGDKLNMIAPSFACENIISFAVNDTPYACSSISRDASLRIDFLAPVLAWGADFRDLGDDVRITGISFFDALDQQITQTIVQDTDDLALAFLGFDLDGTAASYMNFAYLSGAVAQPEEVFGMDNILYRTERDFVEPVPLPASVLFLGAAIGGLGCVRRRKRT